MNIVLPYPVSANRYWHMVKIGPRSALAPTREAKAFKREVGLLAVMAGCRQPLDGRLSLRVELFPKRPLDYLKRVKARPDDWADSVMCLDLGNCEKVLSDALNGVAWHDDKQLHEITLVRRDPDEHGPRAVVTISPIVRAKIAPELPL